ncbi:MAG: ABC transporter permease [Nitrospirae bacterium]|nr:ABC transporter permease [Nitrospirota bacterium]
MLIVAYKNLLYDKIRFITTLVGIAFSVVLIFAQVGIFLGAMNNAASIIDHSGADLWVTSRGTPNFEWAEAIPERFVNVVRSTPGIERAEPYLFAFATVKLENGGREQVVIIGFHPDWGVGGPWEMSIGNIRDVVGGDFVIFDESSQKKLGPLPIGSTREMYGQAVRVVGHSRGVRSITTAPFVFASYKTAKKVGSYYRPEDTAYILATLEPGANARETASLLSERLPYVDVFTTAQFSRRTRRYWTVETGMGVGFALSSFMAFVVGMVVVSQTLYSATVEHLREYGTLKAIGGGNGLIYRIILTQAFISAVLGYGVGRLAMDPLAKGYSSTGIDIVMEPWLQAAVFGMVLVMCGLASIVSVRKAVNTDPAMVFKT